MEKALFEGYLTGRMCLTQSNGILSSPPQIATSSRIPNFIISYRPKHALGHRDQPLGRPTTAGGTSTQTRLIKMSTAGVDAGALALTLADGKDRTPVMTVLILNLQLGAQADSHYGSSPSLSSFYVMVKLLLRLKLKASLKPNRKSSMPDCVRKILQRLQSFRDKVSLSGFQIIGSIKQSNGDGYMRAVVNAEVENSTKVSCVANIAVVVYYGDTKIGSVELENFQIRPEIPTRQEVEWRSRPLNPVNSDVQRLFANQVITKMESPIKLRIENISAKICGRLFNLPRYEIQTQIRGLGIQLVRHVNVHVLLMSVMFRRNVSFELDFASIHQIDAAPENPVDTRLQIHSIDLNVSVRGVHIATVKHNFGNTFFIDPKDRNKTPEIADAYLVGGLLKTLQMGTETSACLDVVVKAASVT
ncbi:hypothetical protein WOLCODRAFT_20581 [Wolfiporia cocos MD-104 SS10]|uniref:Uncharacterized protein n=1 Tax=Wolfiporia cocos (strain MD-104) TaxID=742152 RepID=A0A2H3J3F9_WOLCO|nr:hypothetical protein WOLCODRAFT_20581 [Wolfiporia cocos MD-104 SS10]